jgi:hypothetical protein
VLSWSISRNYKKIWNSTKICVNPRMYLTCGGSVQRPLTSWPSGWLARFYVGLARDFMHMCLHEKGKAKAVEKVGGGQTTWLADHVAGPAGHHLVSYWLNQVSNPSLDLYKYLSTGGNHNTHTPHFGDSTCKAPILYVVARCSLIGRVTRL